MTYEVSVSFNFVQLASCPASLRVQAAAPNKKCNLEQPVSRNVCEWKRGCENRKEPVLFFCFFYVNGGNGGCVVPSARALAVSDSHGQSRGAIMNSQEGLCHWALPDDTLCWARMQRNDGCLSLPARESKWKRTRRTLSDFTDMYFDFLTVWLVNGNKRKRTELPSFRTHDRR